MTNEHLSDQELQQLFCSSDGSDVSADAEHHLSHCKSCQEKMDQLAAKDWWWNEGREVLISSVTEVPNTRASSPSDIKFEGQDGEFTERDAFDPSDLLEDPTHPELLGRLGHYDIESVIGRGGMGVVFRAFDNQLHRVVAIKMLLPHLANFGPARKKFLFEARSAAAIKNPHAVEIYEVCSNGKHPYIVMELVKGCSLQDLVDRDGTRSEIQAMQLGSQIASSLAAAHRLGLVHRDVKPANILVNDSANCAYLTDFGLAKAADDASLTHTGFIAGTPHYMSPEQCKGGPAEAVADLFSLGGVLYYMLAGHPPFRAQNAMSVMHRVCSEKHRSLRKVDSTVSAPVVEVVDRLLQKDPKSRYQSSEEVCDVLSNICAHLMNPQKHVIPKHPERLSRRPYLLFISAIAIAFFTVIFIWQFSTIKWVKKELENGPNQSEFMTITATRGQQGDLEGLNFDHWSPQQIKSEFTAIQQDPEAMIEVYKQNLADVQKHQSNDSWSAGELNFAMGISYYTMEDYTKAAQSFASSERIFLKLLSPEHEKCVRAQIWRMRANRQAGIEADGSEIMTLQSRMSTENYPNDIESAWQAFEINK